jgi:uncharacterized protein YkwD
MKPFFYLTLASLLLLVSCNQSVTPTSGSTLGLLKVTVSLDGSAQAQFMSTSKGELSAQANTVVTDVGLTLSRQFVNFYDDDSATSPTRYVSAVFGITNTTSRTFSNLTLYAVNVVGTTIGGTGVAAMQSAAGVNITTASVAQGMKPTHGMRSTLTGVEVDPDRADLHVISQSEATTIQTGAAALTPPIVGNVLQYGFVARNLSGGRTIGNQGCSGTNCNKGVVTLAYKMPRINPRSANPWTFSLYFVVADESTTIATQSLEEQNSNQGFTSRISALGSAQARTLAGTSYTGGTQFCSVRTAGTSSTPLANLEVGAACLNNPAMLSAINTARATARTCGGTSYPAVPAVSWNSKLARAAIDHSRDMVAYNYVDFYNPVTSDNVFTRIDNAGFVGSSDVAIGVGYANAQAAVSDWLTTSFICAYIMNPSYSQLGMASELGTGSSTYSSYWTLVLGNGN